MIARLFNRKVAIVTAALLLAAGIVFFHVLSQEQSTEQLAGRQQTLTDQAAAAMEEHLRMAQEGLRHLARKGPALLREKDTSADHLEIFYHTLSSNALLAVYLKDSEGKVISEYPPGQLEQAGFPAHLLRNTPIRCSSELISLGRTPVLRLSHPFATSGRNGEVGILILLDRFRDDCLRPLRGTCNFQFLLDENGRFILNRERTLAGKHIRDPSATGASPDYFHFLSAAVRGSYGAPYRGSVSSGAGDVLVTCAPVTVSGSRWNLGLIMPPELVAPIDEANTLFVFAFAGLFLLAVTAALPAARLLAYPRRLQEERALREEETADLRTALDQSRRRAQHLLENAGDAIFFIDPSTGALLEVNRRAEELLGYRPEEIRTLSLGVLFPGREYRRYLRLVKRVLRHGYGEERRLLFRSKDSRQFIGEVHARLGDLEERQVVHVVLRDTTEMHRIESELRRKNRNLTLINEIAHHASGNRNLEEMLYPALYKILDAFSAEGGGIYLEDEESGKDLVLAAHHGLTEEIRNEIGALSRGEGLVGRVAASGQPQTATDLLRDQRVWSEAVRHAGWKGAQAVPLAANEKTVGVLFLFSASHPVLSREDLHLLLTVGKQIGTAVEGARLFAALQRQVRLTQATNQDLENSRRQLRNNLAALEEANRAMAQLERMKSNFLTLASHELRTPLTYILSGAELLTTILEDRLSPDEERTLDVICQGGLRLKEIVEDLIEAARIESQTLYLARERVDLPALLAELCDEFKGTLAERQLAVHLDTFPPASLAGDVHHLKKTFQRLIENAVKFTPGGGRIDISGVRRTTADLYRQAHQLQLFSPVFFASALSGAFLQVTIEDSGVGIDPEDHVRIFDKFYEIGDINEHSTSRTRFGGKGVGLGLTLVKGMVEAHGGMVWVESSGSGGGSAFHVLLPLTAAREESGASG